MIFNHNHNCWKTAKMCTNLNPICVQRRFLTIKTFVSTDSND